MKRLFLSALALTFGLSMATAAMAADAADTSANSKSSAVAAANAAGSQTVTGSVKSMNKDSGTLTVTDPSGNDIELTAKQADLANINEGDTVTAAYVKSGDVNIASSVMKVGGSTGGSTKSPHGSGGSKY